MKILFVHQNFPGQFRHLAPTLLTAGHDVTAIGINNNPVPKGIEIIRYQPKRGNTPNIHPWLLDMESKAIRAEALFHTALKLKNEGYYPDAVIAHPGWGEALFIKDVWPHTKLALYGEFYYQADGTDAKFDPEFASESIAEACRLRMKNAGQDLQFAQADAVICPTLFQCSVLPTHVQQITTVIHDGIDTDLLRPNPNAELRLNNNIVLNKDSEIITFVNRNLEPMRGYHIFMRALPNILKARPNARVIIVGGDDVSYGSKPPTGTTWKQLFLNEVRGQLDMSRVHFVGKIAYANFIKLLQISTVHVYLTYPFVLSWSLLEAMSAGCAIVASDTAPVKEVIDHNVEGKLVNFFDKEGLTKHIVSLLENPDERKQLGEAARSHVKQTYDLDSICLPRQIEWITKLSSLN